MTTSNQFRRIQRSTMAYLVVVLTLIGALQNASLAKDVPLALSFSFTNQAAQAATPQKLLLTLSHGRSKPVHCDVRLTPQVYTNVVPGTSAANFEISPGLIYIESLPRGDTVKEIIISFSKDGEYQVLAEASTADGIGASESFCFIVRDGRVYGAVHFDRCELVIIEQAALRAKGEADDPQSVQREYKARLRERNIIKRGLKRSTKSGSGIHAGETVTILCNWTAPRQGGAHVVLPILNCKIKIERPGDIWGWTWPDTISNDYVRNGQYTFLSDRDDLDFRIVLEMEFDGFAGNSKFTVKDDGNSDPYAIEIPWNQFTQAGTEFQRNGNMFTYTVPFRIWGSVDFDANVFDSAWGVFHGIQEIFRIANSELNIYRTDETDVTYPFAAGSQALGAKVWIGKGDRYDFDIAAHEIGHTIADDYTVLIAEGGSHSSTINQYDNPDNPGTHQNKEASLKLAFSEGFASYWGVGLLEKSSPYGGQLAYVGDKMYNDSENTGATPYEYSLENQPSTDMHGEDAERAAMRLLWDLHDSNDENYSPGTKSLADAMHDGLRGMWDRLNGKNYTNVSDFWIRNWLPGANDDERFASLSKNSLRAAETFVEMGMAPHLIKPDNFTQINLGDSNVQLEFQWQDTKRTGNPVLSLNAYTLVLYKEDLGASILFKKVMNPANATSYTLTPAEIVALTNAIGAYTGDLIAVVYGANTPASGSGIVKTGPYVSNGVRLSRGGRYVPIVVDSSGSMSWNDPNNLRIAAAKEVCNGLVSTNEAQQNKLVADLAAGVDFDDAIEAVQDFIDPPALFPFLDSIDSSGSTRIDLGISKGVQLLEAAGAAGAGIDGHSAIFLFTDGENNAGPGPVIAAVEAAWAKGVRVHYGWLQPGPSPAPTKGLTTYPKLTKGSPSTIEEAVRMTGGNYGLIRDAQSQLAFVNQAFNNGLTVIDKPKDISAGGDIAGHVETPNDLAESFRIQSYRFYGQARENISILLQAVDFDPIVSLFDKNGAYLAVDYDDDADRSITLPFTLPYSGQYVVEVRGKGSQFGKYTLLVEVENAPPFVDVTDQSTATFANWALDAASGALVGSLTLLNNAGAPKSLKQKFWYVLPNTSNLRLASPDGVDENGNPYVDITAQVQAALPGVGNGDLLLDPGESVNISGIRFYSRDRSVPTGLIFAIWADPPPGTTPVVLPSVLPALHVSEVEPGRVVLSWMATSTSVVIEGSDFLGTPNWSVIDAKQELRGDNVSVTLPVSSGTKLFRLRNN